MGESSLRGQTSAGPGRRPGPPGPCPTPRGGWHVSLSWRFGRWVERSAVVSTDAGLHVGCIEEDGGELGVPRDRVLNASGVGSN